MGGPRDERGGILRDQPAGVPDCDSSGYRDRANAESVLVEAIGDRKPIEATLQRWISFQGTQERHCLLLRAWRLPEPGLERLPGRLRIRGGGRRGLKARVAAHAQMTERAAGDVVGTVWTADGLEPSAPDPQPERLDVTAQSLRDIRKFVEVLPHDTNAISIRSHSFKVVDTNLPQLYLVEAVIGETPSASDDPGSSAQS
jgi:hypothetical protein